MFAIRTLTPMTPDEIRQQERMVSMAAEEEVTEFDEIAGTIHKPSVLRVRNRADAIVLVKQILQNGASIDEPSQTMIENLADAILRRKIALEREQADEDAARRRPRQ